MVDLLATVQNAADEEIAQMQNIAETIPEYRILRAMTVSYTHLHQNTLYHSKDLGTATILHPYHPLFGQTFPILKIRKVDRQRLYSLQSEDDIFSVPESWTMDTCQNAFAETYFNDDSIKSLLELVSLLHE